MVELGNCELGIPNSGLRIADCEFLNSRIPQSLVSLRPLCALSETLS